MNKLSINQNLFKKIVDGVKHSVSTEETRPILKYIQIKVEKNILTAYSVDGYRASRIKANLGSVDYGSFKFYIKPINIKATKKGYEDAVIECSKSFVTLEVVTDYGKLKYTFAQPDGDFIDVDKVYEGAAEHDRELGINPRYLIEASKSIETTSTLTRTATLETKANNAQPIIIRSKDNGILNEQLILPVRLVK